LRKFGSKIKKKSKFFATRSRKTFCFWSHVLQFISPCPRVGMWHPTSGNGDVLIRLLKFQGALECWSMLSILPMSSPPYHPYSLAHLLSLSLSPSLSLSLSPTLFLLLLQTYTCGASEARSKSLFRADLR
jgi:hypothetical protein